MDTHQIYKLGLTCPRALQLHFISQRGGLDKFALTLERKQTHTQVLRGYFSMALAQTNCLVGTVDTGQHSKLAGGRPWLMR